MFQVLVGYNFLCSVLSLYSLGVIVKAYYQGGILYTFAMVHDADVKHAFLIYWITKHLELLDTVFMIVRHRQRQITFLHVSCRPGATLCSHGFKRGIPPFQWQIPRGGPM